MVFICVVWGFSISYQLFDDWTTNGTHGAAVGALDTKEIDILGCMSWYALETENFLTLVSQVYPHQYVNKQNKQKFENLISIFFLYFSSVMFYRSIRNIDFIDLRIFKPFSRTIWLCIIISIITMNAFLHLMFNFDHKLIKSTKINLKVNSLLIYTFGVFCQQGNKLKIYSLSGRYLVVFLFLTSILLHNFYTSVLVSTLVEFAPPAVRSLQDVSNSDLSVGFQETPYIIKFLNVIFVLYFSSFIIANLTFYQTDCSRS